MSIIKVLFYGNCQLGAICKTLNLNSNKYHVTYVECHGNEVKNFSQEYFTDMIKTMDIVITQPIRDDYLQKDYLSTTYIIRNCTPDCKVIILPSFYFDLYYFDCRYYEKIRGPSSYHYINMIDCYKQGISEAYYIRHYVNNPDLKSKEQLEKILERNLQELEDRYNDSQKYKIHENVFTIPIRKFIEEKYKDVLLFYTINHPTLVLIQHVCHEILNILHIENTMDYWNDFLSNTDRNIMYKCVEQLVNFKQPAPLLDSHNAYHHDAKSITEHYYSVYKQLDQNCFEHI